MTDEPVPLEGYQKRIYQGLRSIGPEIGQFYLDAIRLLTGKAIGSKAYPLAHLAREIEGGFKDALASNAPEPEKCARCEKAITEGEHVRAIAVAVGMGEDAPFVTRWHDLARTFHKFAHRQGAYGPPTWTRNILDVPWQWE